MPELLADPVNVKRLEPAGDPRDYFGMLLELPRPGAKMQVLLLPKGRMITTRVLRVLAATDGWTIYVQTENSLYSVRPLAPAPAREAV